MVKKRILSAIVFVIFVLSIFAFDLLRVKESSANELGLSLPNQIVELSKVGTELKLSGINVNPENLLDVSFYFSGDSSAKEKEAKKLVEYFLTAMTFEGERLWVNLSPYEKDRVLDEELAQTQLGKVLLKQDYLLKQLSSSLTNPDTELGKEYWNQLSTVDSRFSTKSNAFSKIWIAADKAIVGEDGDLAMVEKSSMNVFTEADYLAMQQNNAVGANGGSPNDFIKERIVPLIKDDVNKGSNFSELRQVYSALILAKWFKDKYFNSIYSHYIDSSKVKGVDTSDPAIKQKVFELYSKSFKEGVYNQIKKVKADNGSVAKKSYVSGGITPSPDSKVETKQLNRQNFDGQTMASGVAIFEPLMKSASVIKMIAITAMLLIAPAIGRFSQIYAQDSETSIASTTQRQSRAAVYQTEQLDSLMAIAANKSLSDNDRGLAMNRMTLDVDLNYFYFNSLFSIYNDESESFEVREKASYVLGWMKDIRVHDGFQQILNQIDLGTINSIDADYVNMYRKVVVSYAEWVQHMREAGFYADRINVANNIIPFADVNINAHDDLRYWAWHALAYLLDNEDVDMIAQLVELRDREIEINKAQAQYAIDQSQDRAPVTVERNYLFRYPDSVVDWTVEEVHTELIRVSQNDDTVQYQLPYIIEAVNYLGDGQYDAFHFGDGNHKDSLSWQVLDSLDETRTRFSRVLNAQDMNDLQAAIDSAKAKIWDRLNPIAIANNNLVVPGRIGPGFVRKVHLNQAIRLDMSAHITIYNLRGQIVGQVQAPRGHFQLNRSNLNLGNGHYLIKVNYDFTTGQRSSNELPPASDDRGTLPGQQENILASRRYNYSEELEGDPDQDSDEGILVVDSEFAQEENSEVDVSAIVQNFFSKLNNAQATNDPAEIAKVSMNNAVRVVRNLDEAGDMTPVAYVKHGGIDMDLDVEVQSSVIKDKLYSTMTKQQIQEHKAQSRFLAGFTFEFNMNKGKVTIDDIIAQKK